MEIIIASNNMSHFLYSFAYLPSLVSTQKQDSGSEGTLTLNAYEVITHHMPGATPVKLLIFTKDTAILTQLNFGSL